MESSKSTKRALLTSALALLMCVTMLVGATFAWFTDTASTGVNKIQAGNLDIKVEYRTTAVGNSSTMPPTCSAQRALCLSRVTQEWWS